MPVGFHQFGAPLERREPHGVLGLDVIGCFRMRIDPGRELSLAPRQETPEIVNERIARWPALRACPHLGCIQARVEKRSLPITVSVDVERTYPLSGVVVLRCRDDFTPVGSFSCDARYWRSQYSLPLDLEPRQLLVPISKGAAGRVVSTVNPPPRFSSWEWPCEDLSVVDVVPGTGIPWAQLWVFDTARLWVGGEWP
jgi:hypothetical protein